MGEIYLILTSDFPGKLKGWWKINSSLQRMWYFESWNPFQKRFFALNPLQSDTLSNSTSSLYLKDKSAPQKGSINYIFQRSQADESSD